MILVQQDYENFGFEINADPFYSAENIAELERRVANLRNGSSVLKEHELIEVDDE